MVCYAVTTGAALIHGILRYKIPSWKTSVHQMWLSLLLVGGALFGVVDHLWNGELFLFGGNLVVDLLLGVTITLVIFITWAILVVLDKSKGISPSKTLN